MTMDLYSHVLVVVPGYYLVCYNNEPQIEPLAKVVVPGYYLVCYNSTMLYADIPQVVVPGYYLVCYNRERKTLHNPNDYAGF